jgi:hypothetical protein
MRYVCYIIQILTVICMICPHTRALRRVCLLGSPPYKSNLFRVQNRFMHNYSDKSDRSHRKKGNNVLKLYSSKIHTKNEMIGSENHSFGDLIQSSGDSDQLLIVLVGLPGLYYVVCIYVCIYLYIYICMCICIYVYIYICIYIFVYICLRIHLYVYVFIFIHIFIYIFTYI